MNRKVDDVPAENSDDKNDSMFEGPSGEMSSTSTRARPFHITHDHNYCYGWAEMENPGFCFREYCLRQQEKDKEILNLRVIVEELQQKLRICETKLKAAQNKGLRFGDLNSDKTVHNLTGIPTIEAFNKLFAFVKGNTKKVSYWRGPSQSARKLRNTISTPKKFGPKRILSEKDEFLITLMKIRLGSTTADFSQGFRVSFTTVSNTFTTWIKLLAKELKCLIHNPSLDVVKKTLPQKFRKPGYSNVRH